MLKFFLEVFYFPFELKDELFNIFLSFLFELIELSVILQSGFLEVAAFHVKRGLKFMDFTPVDFLHANELSLEPLVLYDYILVLVQKVVYLKLQFGDEYFFATEFVFQFYQFVLELNPHFALVVQIILVLLLRLLEFLPLILKHILDLVQTLIFVPVI